MVGEGRADAGAGFVVFGVVPQDHPLSGGGVLPRHFDVDVLDGEQPLCHVEVFWAEGDEFAPAQAGLDGDQDHQLVPGGDVFQQPVELCRGEDAHLGADDLGELGVRGGVGEDQLVADGAGEDAVQQGVVLAHRSGDSPPSTAKVTQDWTVDGRIRPSGMSPKKGSRCRSR